MFLFAHLTAKLSKQDCAQISHMNMLACFTGVLFQLMNFFPARGNKSWILSWLSELCKIYIAYKLCNLTAKKKHKKTPLLWQILNTRETQCLRKTNGYFLNLILELWAAIGPISNVFSSSDDLTIKMGKKSIFWTITLFRDHWCKCIVSSEKWCFLGDWHPHTKSHAFFPTI